MPTHPAPKPTHYLAWSVALAAAVVLIARSHHRLAGRLSDIDRRQACTGRKLSKRLDQLSGSIAGLSLNLGSLRQDIKQHAADAYESGYEARDHDHASNALVVCRQRTTTD